MNVLNICSVCLKTWEVPFICLCTGESFGGVRISWDTWLEREGSKRGRGSCSYYLYLQIQSFIRLASLVYAQHTCVWSFLVMELCLLHPSCPAGVLQRCCWFCWPRRFVGPNLHACLSVVQVPCVRLEIYFLEMDADNAVGSFTITASRSGMISWHAKSWSSGVSTKHKGGIT